MPTSTLTTTYYRVVWNGSAPNDYNALTGDQAGGIDNTNPEGYNRRVSTTGTVHAPTVTAGHSIFINTVEIVFTSTTLAQCIIDINAFTNQTDVVAHQTTVSGYLTLTNATDYEDNAFNVIAGTGTALADLGLTANTYDKWPTMVGTTVTLPLNDADNIIINGVVVTFTTAGGLNLAGVVSTINSLTFSHNVTAYVCANVIQLCSNGQPWKLAAGTTAGTLGNIGFTAGLKGGYPTTRALSLSKERANMRWQQIVNNLGLIISPVVVRDFVKTTDYTGNSPLVTMTWTVGYDRIDYLSIIDSTQPTVVYLTGVDAIKRLIAMSLTTNNLVSNQEIFDPTIGAFGNTGNRSNSTQIVRLTAAALDTDVTNVEANLTVTVIATV